MKTTEVKNNLEAIKEYINKLSDSEKVNFHNIYCQNCNYPNDEIFANDEEFFNTFFNGKVIDAIRAICYGFYKYTEKFVQFNGYGNLVSFNDPEDYDGIIDISEIAEDILNNPSDYDIELIEEEETE